MSKARKASRLPKEKLETVVRSKIEKEKPKEKSRVVHHQTNENVAIFFECFLVFFLALKYRKTQNIQPNNQQATANSCSALLRLYKCIFLYLSTFFRIKVHLYFSFSFSFPFILTYFFKLIRNASNNLAAFDTFLLIRYYSLCILLTPSFNSFSTFSFYFILLTFSLFFFFSSIYLFIFFSIH